MTYPDGTVAYEGDWVKGNPAPGGAY